MTKSELFATVKEVNQLVDKMAQVASDSKEYYDLSDAIGYALDSIQFGYHPWYSLHMSNRTGHYYIKFS